MDRAADRCLAPGQVDYSLARVLLTFFVVLLGLGWPYDDWTLNAHVDRINRGG